MASTIKSFSYSLIVHMGIVVCASLIFVSPEKIEQNFGNAIKLQLNSIGNAYNGSSGLEKVSKKVTQSATKAQVPMAASAAEVNNNIASGKAEAGNQSGSGSGTRDSFSSSIQNYSEPVYPRLAIKRGLQGSIKVKIEVGPDGVPSQVLILKTSGHKILDESALSAVKKWVFIKKPNASYFVEKTIVFELNA
jgi:TonB family protein